jgi:hypothetical protein
MNDNYGRYLVPDEIRSQTMIFRHISFFDIVAVAIYWAVFNAAAPLVDARVSLAYNITNVLVPVVLTRRSTANRGRTVLESVLLFFLRDKTVYHGMETDNEEIRHSRD